MAAVAVITADAVFSVEGLQPLLITEAAVGAALFHQKLGILSIERPALRLDIGAHRAAQIGTLVPGEAALAQGGVDDVGGPLHQPPLVGVLDAQDEFAAGMAGDEPGIQGGAQIAHMHVAGGGGGEPGTDLSGRDAALHLLKPSHFHDDSSKTIFCVSGTILTAWVKLVKRCGM